MSGTKVCAKCGESTSLDQFGRDRRNPDGRTARCQGCVRQDNREANRRFRAAKPDAVRAIKRRYRTANLDKVREANREHKRRRYAADPQEAREQRYRERASCRSRIFDHYGWSCACCGTSSPKTSGRSAGGFLRVLRHCGAPDHRPHQW